MVSLPWKLQLGDNKWKYNNKSRIWNREKLFWSIKKIFKNQILSPKLWYICQIHTIPKYIKNEIERKTISSGRQKKKKTFQAHLNFWLHFNNKTFSTHSFIEETRYQPLFLNSHTKLRFSFDNPYFYCIPPRNILYHNINHK